MSAFFSKLKNSVQTAVGLKKPSQGHVLGEKSSSSSNDREIVNLDTIYGDHTFDITFTTEILGFGVSPDRHGLPMVAVINNLDLRSQYSLSVQDIITAVDGNDVLSFDSFMEVICVIGRPVTIR